MEEREIIMDCDNPKTKGWGECEKIRPFERDWHYQDQCIEHKDHNTYTSFYTEAAGDIFREISNLRVDVGRWHDRAYIREKLNKLKTINDLNIADLKDKDYFTSDKEREILKQQKKRVKTWHEVTDPKVRKRATITPACKGLEAYKEAQVETIKIIDKLLDWGLDVKSHDEIRNDVNRYIEKIGGLIGV